jgi:hypothetical protein
MHLLHLFLPLPFLPLPFDSVTGTEAGASLWIVGFASSSWSASTFSVGGSVGSESGDIGFSTTSIWAGETEESASMTTGADSRAGSGSRTDSGIGALNGTTTDSCATGFILGDGATATCGFACVTGIGCGIGTASGCIAGFVIFCTGFSWVLVPSAVDWTDRPSSRVWV